MERSAVPPSKARRRLRNVAGALVALVGVYALAVGLALPPIAKRLIADKGGERLGRVVVLDELAINPFTLDATARGFRILEADRKTPFVSFDTLDIEGSATSLYRFAPVADSLTLTGLKVNAVRDTDTRYNFTDIIARLAAKPKDADKAQFSVSNIRVVNARIDFDDRPKGAKHQVTDIHVAVPFVSSLPRHLKEYVQPAFSANVNGSPLRLSGETLPFEDSLRTHVAIDLAGLDLKRYLEYSPVPLPVAVDSGQLDAKLSVRFTQAHGKDPTVEMSGTLALRDLAISKPGEGRIVQAKGIDVDIASLDPLTGIAKISRVRVADATGLDGDARVPAIEAHDIAVDAGRKTASIASVESRGGILNVKRTGQGKLEMPAPLPWNVSLARLALADYKVNVLDVAVKPNVTHRVAVASLELADVSTESLLKGTLAAKLALERGATVDVASSFTLDPLRVEAKVDARRIDLVPLRPYAQQFEMVVLKSGAASTKGTLAVRGKIDDLRIAYEGAAEIANLATVDTQNREDLLNWRSVRASAVKAAFAPDAPLDLVVGEIVVDKVFSRIVVNPDGKLNLQQLRTATPEEPRAPTRNPDPRPRNVRIDRITFVDGRLDFTDHFIRPNYSADVGDLQGSVTGLSSDPSARAVIDLKGRFDRNAPVTIAGTVNPLAADLFLDVAAKGKDIELPTFTAYSQRYAGYGITEGRLTLDVKYHVENGKLEGRNNIVIDRLTFGDKVEGPDATKLPVLFAVSLLKDADGRIQLELPISGSLEDPQFDIGALLTQVLGNVLKKAVTAPFSLLAAAFGGSGGKGGADGANAGPGDDLAYVAFEPGRAQLGPAEEKKLATLARALQGRPGLKLEVASRSDEDRDMKALRKAALRKQIIANQGGGAAAIDEAKYPQLVKALYVKGDFPKPEKGAPEPGVAEMEARLLEKVTVSDEEMRALATRRMEQVRSYLVAKGQVSEERVLLASSGDAPAEGAQAGRVNFSLR